MPVQKGGKRKAARQREATKRGEIVPEQRDPSLVTDPTYVENGETSGDSDVEILEAPQEASLAASNISSGSIDPVAGKADLVNKRKARRENTDLIPDRPSKVARTTAWRVQNGKTKKARAVAMQPSVASFFKSEPSAIKQLLVQNARQESEEKDSDIEIIDAPAPANAVFSPATTVPLPQEPEGSQPDQSSEAMDIDAVGTIGEGIVSDSQELPTQTSLEQLAGECQDCEPISTVATSADTPNVESLEARANSTTPALEDENENDEDELLSGKPQEQHQRLRRLIDVQRKKYKKKKTLVTDTSAANTLIDLEALRQYADLRFRHNQDIDGLKKRLASCPRSAQHRIRARITKIRPALDASTAVAARCSRGPHFARTLRSMANHLLRTGLLPEKRQGKGAHHESLLNRPDISSALQKWVKGVVPFDEGGFKGRMRPAKLRRYVNDFLLPYLKIEKTISESTAVRWLKKLGFSLSRVQKGVYVDGHERSDVVATREDLISYMYTQVLPFCYTYEGPELTEVPPTLPEGGKVHYPIYHDETCVHANDLDNFVWMREGEQPLRGKSRGRIVHVSDFVIEHCGRLSLNETEIASQMKLPARPSPPPPPGTVAAEPDIATEDTVQTAASAGTTTVNVTAKTKSTKSKKVTKPKKVPKKKNTKKTSTEGRTFAEHDTEWTPPPPPAPFSAYRLSSFDARRIIYPGSNYDPWWDMPQLIAQTKDAIEIFEAKYPDGVAVFIFDCSSAHEAFASDALLAHKMNRGPGGKQPVMRDTVVPSTGEHQSMNFLLSYTGVDKDGNSLAGKQKGMEQVLRERGLLAALEQKHGSKVVAICSKCKQSQAAREAALKAAKAKEDEIEGSGVAALNSRGVSDLDASDLTRPKDCCMQRVLSLEKDFMAEKPLLQLVIEKAGHKCLFLPKFHCELNPIEMVWGQAKRRFRELADGTFPTAQQLVPECLDAVSLSNVRGYFRHCWRYMDAYRRGLNIKQAAYAVKKYKSHRRIPGSIMMDINIIRRGATG